MKNFEVGVNTYLTVEEADSIVLDEFSETDNMYKLWETLDENGKQRMLVNGARKISSIVWRGIRYPGYQNLQWPRLIQYRYVECPYDVKVGIIKQALTDEIYNSKQEASLINSGVKQYVIKGASITFADKASSINKLTNGIWEEVYREYFEQWTA